MAIEVIVEGSVPMHTLTPDLYHRFGEVEAQQFETIFGPAVDADSIIYDPSGKVLQELGRRGCAPTRVEAPSGPNTTWVRFYMLPRETRWDDTLFGRYQVVMAPPIGNDYRLMLLTADLLEMMRGWALDDFSDEFRHRLVQQRRALPAPSIYVLVATSFDLLRPPGEKLLFRRQAVQNADLVSSVLTAVPFLPPWQEIRVVGDHPLTQDAERLAVGLAEAAGGIPLARIANRERPSFVVGDQVVFLQVPGAAHEVSVVEVVDDVAAGHRLLRPGMMLFDADE